MCYIMHILSFDIVFAFVQSDSLWPHGLQHTRLPCPSLSPRVCSDSCPMSCWCHPTISSSVTHFACLQSFSPSGSFPMNKVFASTGQSIGVSASVFPMNYPLTLCQMHPVFSANLYNTLPLAVVQWLSRVWLFATPWAAVGQASLSFPISHNSLKLMFIELAMPSNHLVL